METTNYRSANFSGVTANGSYGAGNPNFEPASNPPPVNTTTDASTLGQSSTPQFPTTIPDASKVASNASSANTSIPNPIPNATDIVNEGANQTPAEKTNQTLLQKVAEMIRGDKGQTELTNDAEAAAGVPALTKASNDLNTQLEGLNNQATALQNEARSGGAIENGISKDYAGGTVGGVAPVSAAALKENQIKQSAVASQALTVKSALFGAQGNLTLAKDAADKAATAQFEHQQQQLDYMKALVDANTPTMTKEEKAQATIVQSKLQDRQNAIDNAKDDKKAIIALATAAMKNNPNDPAAQYAAQQALAESNSQTPGLNEAFGLVGKYQTDPIAVQKSLGELQAQRDAHDLSVANAAKVRAETGAVTGIDTSTLPPEQKPLVDAFNNVAIGLTSSQMKSAQTTFNNALKSGDLTSARQIVVRAATQGLNASDQTQALGRTQAISALDDIQKLLDDAKSKGVDTNLISGNVTDVAEKLGTTNNPALSYISSRIASILQVYRRAMTGVAFSPAESKQYEQLFPSTTKTGELNTTKIQALRDSLDSNNRAVLGFAMGDNNYNALFGPSNTNQLPSQGQVIEYNGQQFQTDANGNFDPTKPLNPYSGGGSPF